MDDKSSNLETAQIQRQYPGALLEKKKKLLRGKSHWSVETASGGQPLLIHCQTGVWSLLQKRINTGPQQSACGKQRKDFTIFCVFTQYFVKMRKTN